MQYWVPLSPRFSLNAKLPQNLQENAEPLQQDITLSDFETETNKLFQCAVGKGEEYFNPSTFQVLSPISLSNDGPEFMVL